MWTCPKCQEENEDSYEVCFNCGTTQEGKEDPQFRRAEEMEPFLEPDFEAERPLTEALPQTILPEALQRTEPPVARPRWPPDRCPHCQSADLGRDTASPWPLVVAVLVLLVAELFTRSGWPDTGLSVKFLGLILLVIGLIGPLFTANAWCRSCGVRFKKRYRLDRPAGQSDEPEA